MTPKSVCVGRAVDSVLAPLQSNQPSGASLPAKATIAPEPMPPDEFGRAWLALWAFGISTQPGNVMVRLLSCTLSNCTLPGKVKVRSPVKVVALVPPDSVIISRAALDWIRLCHQQLLLISFFVSCRSFRAVMCSITISRQNRPNELSLFPTTSRVSYPC